MSLINREELLKSIMDDGGLQYPRWWYLEKVKNAQPEPAISLSWIETHIEWLESLDNAFSSLTALQISTMVKKWKDEPDDFCSRGVKKDGAND